MGQRPSPYGNRNLVLGKLDGFRECTRARLPALSCLGFPLAPRRQWFRPSFHWAPGGKWASAQASYEGRNLVLGKLDCFRKCTRAHLPVLSCLSFPLPPRRQWARPSFPLVPRRKWDSAQAVGLASMGTATWYWESPMVLENALGLISQPSAGSVSFAA